MWFDSWSDIIRVLVVGTAAYATLVTVLRVSGKRTLAKLNAFDFVVTVALGSTLATILLSSDVSWAEGATALGGLAALQFLVARLVSRHRFLRTLVTSEPTFLVRDGVLLEEALHRQRVAVADVRQVLRSSGLVDLSQVAAVVLETDGSVSVIAADRRSNAEHWALKDVSLPATR